MKRITLACIALTAAAAASASANLITNGSFETGTNPSSFVAIGLGSSAITGWSVVSGTVDYIGTYWQASDGVRSVDLSGNGAGAIAQTVYTDAATNYLLQFDLAGNPVCSDAIKSVRVTIGEYGQSPALSSVFDFDKTGKSQTNMGWLTQSLYFTGLGANTQITFTSLENSYCGPALDNVRLTAATAVPEPVSMTLGLIGFAALAASKRVRRK